MTIYRYLCLNPQCDNRSHQLIKKDDSTINQEELCESCEAPIKLMGEVVYGGIGGKFRSSTPAERKKMLLDRSSKHFKTSGLAEKKRALGQQFRKEAIQIGKGEL